MHCNPLQRCMLAGALAAALAICAPGPAGAVTGALDNVPAATLLLPYFEVNTTAATGAQTRFSVINTGAAPALAKVTLWSNVGVPTFNFDLYLEGRDTVEVDLRLLFKGVLPQTGPGLGELGAESDPSVDFPSCELGADTALGVSLPIPGVLSASQVEHLVNAHTGRTSASLANQCAGVRIGNDRIARGYITVDSVNQCSTVMPTEPGYFVGGGLGIASNANVLAGSFSLVGRPGEVQGGTSPLVHIEADAVAALTTTPGNYTFYANLVASTAADNREPAGTVWQARQLGSPLFDNGAEAIVWRDPGGRAPLPFNDDGCAEAPAPFPLGQTSVAAFDERENIEILNAAVVFPNPQPPDVLPFPLAAQRTGFGMFSPFESGSAFLNLNSFPNPAGLNMGAPDVRQSVVLIRHRHGSNFGPFLPATYSAGPQHQSLGATSCGDGENCNSFTGAFF